MCCKKCGYYGCFSPRKTKSKYWSQTIGQELGIMEYPNYEAIPTGVKAWVTIKANKRGLDSIMVKAGFKAAFTKRENERKRRGKKK